MLPHMFHMHIWGRTQLHAQLPRGCRHLGQNRIRNFIPNLFLGFFVILKKGKVPVI